MTGICAAAIWPLLSEYSLGVRFSAGIDEVNDTLSMEEVQALTVAERPEHESHKVERAEHDLQGQEVDTGYSPSERENTRRGEQCAWQSTEPGARLSLLDLANTVTTPEGPDYRVDVDDDGYRYEAKDKVQAVFRVFLRGWLAGEGGGWRLEDAHVHPCA